MKPRISYADVAWSAAFARIEPGQHLTASSGLVYSVIWKHDDLPRQWLVLRYRAGKKLEQRIVRKGDPLLLELRHE